MELNATTSTTRTNAMSWYRKALDIHHNHRPPFIRSGIVEITSHWGIKVRKDSTLVMRPPKNVSMADLQSGFSYFDLVRSYDPFFLLPIRATACFPSV